MKQTSSKLLAPLGVLAGLVFIGLFFFARFSPKDSAARADSLSSTRIEQADGKYEHVTFAMGCFWHSEEMFSEIKGVITADPGYSGGTEPNPSYEQVSSEATRYAESVEVTFDPKVVSYGKLLQVFFTEHDPTTPNYSVPDRGPQYRSMIFYRNASQKQQAEAYIAKLTEIHSFKAPIVTEVVPFVKFWRAEDYHIHYYRSHPDQSYIANVTRPEIEKFRKDFPDLLQ